MFKEVIEKMELFEGVRVIRITGSMNASGNTDGMLEVIMYNGCNIPKVLLDYATTLSQSAQIAPIDIQGKFAMQTQMQSPITYEITFKYDRKFLYLLDRAHEAELYKKHNAEADIFIEKWLSNG